MSKQDIIQTFRRLSNDVWKTPITDIGFTEEHIIINNHAFYPVSKWNTFEAMKDYVARVFV